jgi:hypothetical protein
MSSSVSEYYTEDYTDSSLPLTDDPEYEPYDKDEAALKARLKHLNRQFEHLRHHRKKRLLSGSRQSQQPRFRPFTPSQNKRQRFPPGGEYAPPPRPPWADPNFHEARNWGSQRTLVPSEYPQTNHPAQNPAFGDPPQRFPSNFWDQLNQFESGFEQRPEKSLVSARKPWIPNTGQPTYLQPGNSGFGPQDTESYIPYYLPHYIPPVSSIPGAGAIGGTGNPSRPETNLNVGHEPERPGAGGVGPFDNTTFQHALPIRQQKPREAALAQDFDIASLVPETEMATTQVDLIHDPSQASKDMSIRLELDMEEDWDDDLEEFCRLSRLGLINDAKEHFRSTLEHVSTIPYIRVQYAEMLLFSGDYKGFHNLDFLPEYPPQPSEETADDRSRGKLVANYALLDLLSQRPIPKYLTAAWSVVRTTLKALATESTVGYTEVRVQPHFPPPPQGCI